MHYFGDRSAQDFGALVLALACWWTTRSWKYYMIKMEQVTDRLKAASCA
jgi:hypothetical protein